MEQAACGSLSEYFRHPVSTLKQSHLVSAAEDLAQALHYLVCVHIIIIIIIKCFNGPVCRHNMTNRGPGRQIILYHYMYLNYFAILS